MDQKVDENYESESSDGIVLNFDKDSPLQETTVCRSDSLFEILNEIRCTRNSNKTSSNEIVTKQSREFWIQIFRNAFIKGSQESVNKDDLLFFVCENPSIKSEVEIKVFRKTSPRIGEIFLSQYLEWEETVYLNLILQHFTYILTMAIVTRTGPKEYQILHKVSERVYASPSKRDMDSKGTEEKITYPQIYFTVDNFEEVFSRCVCRDSESICVELTAYDHQGALQAVIFLGTVRYNSVREVYDRKQAESASFSNRLFSRTASGLFRAGSSSSNLNNNPNMEFIKMLGPDGKGHAQVAVTGLNIPMVTSRETGTRCVHVTKKHGANYLAGSESHIDRCGREREDLANGHLTPSHVSNSSSMTSSFIKQQHTSTTTGNNVNQRRANSKVMDFVVNSGSTNLVKNVLSSKMRKSQSDGGTFERSDADDDDVNENKSSALGGMTSSESAASGRTTSHIYSEEFEETQTGSSTWGQSFNQAWYWFKERRKATSPALNASVTYIALPWYRIVADILEPHLRPILTFDRINIKQFD